MEQLQNQNKNNKKKVEHINKTVVKLGLVVVGVVVAVVLSRSMVFAATSMQSVDILEAKIVPVDADIEITSTSGDKVVEPEYDLSLLFNGVKDIKLKVVNRDNDGNVTYEGEIWNFEGDYSPGTKDFVLNLDDFGWYGNFTFTASAVDQDNRTIEKVLFVEYKNQEVSDYKTVKIGIYDDSNKLVRVAVIDKETEKMKVYDVDGSLLFVVPGVIKPDEKFEIPFDGLEYGEYTVEVQYLDKDNNQVGEIYVYTVKYYGDEEYVPVPDTGGLFKGLNISSEDYLITGVLMLGAASVVVFVMTRKRPRSRHRGRKVVK